MAAGASRQFLSARMAVRLSLLVLLCIMVACSGHYAISGDEPVQDWYGTYLWRYLSQGRLPPMAPVAAAQMEPYGGLFDTACAAFTPFIPAEHFDARHLLNALAGWLTIFFAARIGRLLHGDRLALITTWLLAFSPRFFGDCMNNPKDIPFALGMVAGTYALLKIGRAYPTPGRKDMVLLAGSIAVALGVRPGGLLLLFYLPVALLFIKQKEVLPVRVKPWLAITAACIAGYALAIICWPYALENPFLNPARALRQMSNYTIFPPTLFNGRDIAVNEVPAAYLPVWIGITTPLIVLIPWMLTPFWLRSESKKRQWAFLLFTLFFPPLFAIVKQSPLYDGWRHFYFIYPAIVLLAGRSLLYLFDFFHNRVQRIALSVIIAAGLGMPLAFCIKNHPLEAVYFNELCGGIQGAYSRFETDYYAVGLETACRELLKTASFSGLKDSVVVATNCLPAQCAIYLQRINPKIRLLPVHYGERYDAAWDYAIFWTRWIDNSLIAGRHFPPYGTYRTIAAGGAPLYALVGGADHAESVRLAGLLAAGNGPHAFRLCDSLIKTQPWNETLHARRAQAFLLLGDTVAAGKEWRIAAQISPADRIVLRLSRQLNTVRY